MPFLSGPRKSYAASVALLDHMVDYCTEEDKCLHNLLLHYFSDRSALPTGRCGGKCGNCMRALGLPGAPPTRAELAAVAVEKRKQTPVPVFVKASTLLGSGAPQQPLRGGRSGGAAPKRSRAGGKGKGQPSGRFSVASPIAPASSNGPPGTVIQPPTRDVLDQGRAASLAARAKKMQAASLAAAGQHRLAAIQQKQAVQSSASGRGIQGHSGASQDDAWLDDY